MTIPQLKSLQKKLGLTNKQLAEALGVKENTVNRWRMGVHPISESSARFIRLIAKTMLNPSQK